MILQNEKEQRVYFYLLKFLLDFIDIKCYYYVQWKYTLKITPILKMYVFDNLLVITWVPNSIRTLLALIFWESWWKLSSLNYTAVQIEYQTFIGIIIH